VPALHGISHEHYAVHATQLFLTGRVYPTLMSSVPHAWVLFSCFGMILCI